MASKVLSIRIDEDLWDRIRAHAAKRGMSAQDYVVRALVRDDFDERFRAAEQEADRLYGTGGRPPRGGSGHTRPNAGIR